MDSISFTRRMLLLLSVWENITVFDTMASESSCLLNQFGRLAAIVVIVITQTIVQENLIRDMPRKPYN